MMIIYTDASYKCYEKEWPLRRLIGYYIIKNDELHVEEVRYVPRRENINAVRNISSLYLEFKSVMFSLKNINNVINEKIVILNDCSVVVDLLNNINDIKFKRKKIERYLKKEIQEVIALLENFIDIEFRYVNREENLAHRVIEKE